MEENVIQQRCSPHSQEVVAFDLNPKAERKDKYLCLKCVNTPTPNRQSKLIQEAQYLFREMKKSEFNNKEKQITSNLEKLSNLQNEIKQFHEFFSNKITESQKILNSRKQKEQNELNEIIKSQQEMQTEQDLLDLTNYVNYGFINNNQINPKQQEFINQIQQLLDYQIFEQKLLDISNQVESIYTKSFTKEQAKLILQQEFKENQSEFVSLRYQCQNHKSNIMLVSLEPGQIEERFYCQKCKQEKKLDGLTLIFELNQNWQDYLQNVNQSNINFHTIRQNNQIKINELIVQQEIFNKQIFKQLQQMLKNQNNKILKDIYDSQTSFLNKQLYQMELKEIEQVALILSQKDPMYEIQQKYLQLQIEDQKLKDQLLEQLNIQRKNVLETSIQIDKLFCMNDYIKKFNEFQLEQLFLYQIIPQFYDNYSKFSNKYKLIIDFIKSKYFKFQINTINQQSNNQTENKPFMHNKILEQMQLIEKIKLKQVSLTTHNIHNQLKFQIKRSQNNLQTENLHNQLKFQIKRSQNNLKTENLHNQLKFQIECPQNNLKTQNLHIQQKFQNKDSQNNLQTQNLHIQQKYLAIQNNKQIMSDKIIEQYKKDLKFSEILKHYSIKFNGNYKIAQTYKEFNIWAVCLCDQPIPLVGTVSVDFKINKLYWVMIGICKSKLIKQDFNFDNRSSNQHGYYVLMEDSSIYSHHDSLKNYEKLGFNFNSGDIINVEVNQTTKTIIWRKRDQGLSCSLYFQPSEDLHFCCCLYSKSDRMSEVEII